MIKEKITKNAFKLPTIRQSSFPHTQPLLDWANKKEDPPTPKQHPGVPHSSLITILDQESYEEYLQTVGFRIGDFVVSKWWGKDVNISVYHVHFILNITQKLINVHGGVRPYKAPEAYYICQALPELSGAGPDERYLPWVRWQSLEDFRVITEEEFNTLVKPKYDLVQNNIKHILETDGLSADAGLPESR